MAYRRPAVTVTQEFVGLQPALASFALPSVIIGASYQLFSGDLMGSYTGAAATLAYASLPGGFQVDLEELADDEIFPATKFPISAEIRAAVLQIVATSSSGTPVDALNFVATGLLDDVAAGDKLIISGGANAGTYTVRSKVSADQVVLQSPLPDPSLSGMSFVVNRNVSLIALERGTDYTADANGLSLVAALEYDGFPIISGSVYASYRGLRNDLASEVRRFETNTALQAFFGSSQVNPANPLAFGLYISLLNTVTPMYGLGLNELASSDELLSFAAAFDVVKTTDMYFLCILTQNPAVHPVLKTFVEGESAPAKGRERTGGINRQIKTIETMVDVSTTVTTTSGSRTIVATQSDGAVSAPDLNTLSDAAPANIFANVAKGDTVVVTGGTNAVTGEFSVTSKTSGSVIVLSGDIASGSTTDLEYYIVRKDGLAADGFSLYDRNAEFLVEGVAPGHYLVIASGTYAGRYRIGQVISDKEIRLQASINGVTSLQTAIEYEVNRDMGKSEQAEFIKAYSQSIGSRRIIHVWPDSLKTPVANVLKDVPGFYGTCALAALTTGLPTQQGFTNLSVSGFLGLSHSSKYFDDDLLDVIADGGTTILAQDGEDQPLFIRHQLTTDRSAIKFQEFSLTKNVDFAAKFIRRRYQSFIGPYNIITTTLDSLKTSAKGILSYLIEDTKQDKIGGVIKSGYLKQLIEDPVNIDTVKMRFKLDFPIPLNNIDITLEI